VTFKDFLVLEPAALRFIVRRYQHFDGSDQSLSCQRVELFLGWGKMVATPFHTDFLMLAEVLQKELDIYPDRNTYSIRREELQQAIGDLETLALLVGERHA